MNPAWLESQSGRSQVHLTAATAIEGDDSSHNTASSSNGGLASGEKGIDSVSDIVSNQLPQQVDSTSYLAPIQTIFDKPLFEVAHLSASSGSVSVAPKKAGTSMAELIKKAKAKDSASLNSVNSQKTVLSEITISASSTAELDSLNELERLDIDNVKSKLEGKKDLIEKLQKKKSQSKQNYSVDSILKKKAVQSSTSLSAWEQLQEDERSQVERLKAIQEEKLRKGV
jgi:hypothetical protein